MEEFVVANMSSGLLLYHYRRPAAAAAVCAAAGQRRFTFSPLRQRRPEQQSPEAAAYQHWLHLVNVEAVGGAADGAAVQGERRAVGYARGAQLDVFAAATVAAPLCRAVDVRRVCGELLRGFSEAFRGSLSEDCGVRRARYYRYDGVLAERFCWAAFGQLARVVAVYRGDEPAGPAALARLAPAARAIALNGRQLLFRYRGLLVHARGAPAAVRRLAALAAQVV